MTEFIQTFLLVCSMVTICVEFANISVYGWFAKEEDIMNYINEYGIFSKNPFNTDILSPSVKEKTFEESIKILTDTRYISIITLSLLSKYQVKGMGLVPKWSKAHRQIKELYKQSKIDGHDFESN